MNIENLNEKDKEELIEIILKQKEGFKSIQSIHRELMIDKDKEIQDLKKKTIGC